MPPDLSGVGLGAAASPFQSVSSDGWDAFWFALFLLTFICFKTFSAVYSFSCFFSLSLHF